MQVHAFVWQDGQMMDLGSLRGADWSSVAYDINDAGVVVGQSDCTSPGCAFVWTSAEGMRPLQGLIDPSAGWWLSRATGVNDAGWIVGNGLLNGVARDFLLIPVLEAASWHLATAGLFLVVGWRRRARTKAAAPPAKTPQQVRAGT